MKTRFALASFLALALGSVFWLPAFPAGRGWFPAPLDDVYIHFDFARAIAVGHPFEWIPGQGYSSGETAPLYALLLAVGYLFGLRGALLGGWAAALAVAGVAVFVTSLRSLAHPCRPWLAWLVAIVPMSIGLVGWSLFSGMEIAVLAGVIGRALVALDRARRVPQGHARAEWRLGLWGVPLVLLRPEAGALVLVLALVAARGSGPRSAIATIARVALPGAITTSTLLALHWLFTGDPRAAGAQLKLLSSNPFLSDVDRARTFAENLIVLWAKGLRGELAVHPALAVVWPVLALLGMFAGGRRPVATACVLGAIGWTLLASWNGNAPFHNFRYYAPPLLMFASAAALGVAVVARRRHLVGALVAIGVCASAGTRVPKQVRHFRTAVTNVRDQHLELASRIPSGARVLVGDAGAIPFVSGLPAVDALGLGGMRRLPFARAAVHGEAATIELLEHLPPAERPTHLALYPNWFPTLTTRFGREIDRVTITNNVICGGPTKALYVADWSSLDDTRADALDELDVADVMSETEHAYVSPAPRGGWTTSEILLDAAGVRRFDGGRIIPEGTSESFVLAAFGPLKLRMRTDGASRRALVRTERGSAVLTAAARPEGRWSVASASIVVTQGERIVIDAVEGDLHDFHLWVTRDDH